MDKFLSLFCIISIIKCGQSLYDEPDEKPFIEIDPPGPFTVNQEINFNCSLLTKRLDRAKIRLYVFHLRTPIDEIPQNWLPWRSPNTRMLIDDETDLIVASGTIAIRQNTTGIACSTLLDASKNSTRIIVPIEFENLGYLKEGGDDGDAASRNGIIIGSVIVFLLIFGIIAAFILYKRKQSYRSNAWVPAAHSSPMNDDNIEMSDHRKRAPNVYRPTKNVLDDDI